MYNVIPKYIRMPFAAGTDRNNMLPSALRGRNGLQWQRGSNNQEGASFRRETTLNAYPACWNTNQITDAQRFEYLLSTLPRVVQHAHSSTTEYSSVCYHVIMKEKFKLGQSRHALSKCFRAEALRSKDLKPLTLELKKALCTHVT